MFQQSTGVGKRQEERKRYWWYWLLSQVNPIFLQKEQVSHPLSYSGKKLDKAVKSITWEESVLRMESHRHSHIFPPLVLSLSDSSWSSNLLMWHQDRFAFSKLLLLLSRGVNSQFVILCEYSSREGRNKRGKEILKTSDNNKARDLEVFKSDLTYCTGGTLRPSLLWPVLLLVCVASFSPTETCPSWRPMFPHQTISCSVSPKNKPINSGENKRKFTKEQYCLW